MAKVRRVMDRFMMFCFVQISDAVNPPASRGKTIRPGCDNMLKRSDEFRS
jgi:hypothetical protein